MPEWIKVWPSLIPILSGTFSHVVWSEKKHENVMRRKKDILKNIRYRLSIDMQYRVFPTTEQDQPTDQAQFQDRVQDFLASNNKSLTDFTLCDHYYRLYKVAYYAHKYSLLALIVLGLFGWFYFYETKRYLSWIFVITTLLAIIIPLIVIIFQKDRLNELACEYEALDEKS